MYKNNNKFSYGFQFCFFLGTVLMVSGCQANPPQYQNAGYRSASTGYFTLAANAGFVEARIKLRVNSATITGGQILRNMLKGDSGHSNAQQTDKSHNAYERQQVAEDVNWYRKTDVIYSYNLCYRATALSLLSAKKPEYRPNQGGYS